MRYVFEIPGTLPTLNEYMNRERANRYAAASMKKQVQKRIRECMENPPRFKGYVEVEFSWYRCAARGERYP